MFLLFVHPDHAGRGIGRILLDAVHDALRAAGSRAAFPCTHEQNERALAVYIAAGYPLRLSPCLGLPRRQPA